MGNSTAKGVRKLVSPVTRAFYGSGSGNDESAVDGAARSAVCSRRYRVAATPFVLTRTSSMFFDEDGDLAHEFYEEVPANSASGKMKGHMRRIYRNLTPQGIVEYDVPRLHPTLPAVLYEVT